MSALPAKRRAGEDPPWIADGPPPVRGGAGSRRIQPGEVHLHWLGLIPALLATIVAFPFEVNPLWSLGIAVLVVVVFVVRMQAPRFGNKPVYFLHAVILALAATSLMIPDQAGLAPRSMVGQFVAFASLSVLLLPPQTYRTFTACVVCLMTLVSNGLMRTDLEYSFCLAGFLLTLPGLMILGHAHESVRARGVQWRGAARTQRSRAFASVRRFLEALFTLAVGVALYYVLPKPAVMPISDGRFAGVANSFQDGVDVGRGPIPRGGSPFLTIDAPAAPYLLGQVFDRYDVGRWSRTPGLERTLLDRTGKFALPLGVDHRHGDDRKQRAVIRLIRELPDLLLLPEGTRTLECASWHVLGNPPLHLRAWSSTPLTTYAVELVPPARIESLTTPHAPIGGEHAGLTWGKGPHPKPQGEDGPPASTRIVPPSVDSRVIALAKEWVQGAKTDAQKVQALIEKLGARCRYDTSSLTPRGMDPVTYLLFESRAGYCMHFATALAVLCRVVGVPARLATGYAPGTPVDPKAVSTPRTFAVRPRDAHAWTHVWIEGHGWVSVDATEGIIVVSYRDSAEDLLAGDPLAPATGASLDLPWLRSATRAVNGVTSAAQEHVGALVTAGGCVVVLWAFAAWWRGRKNPDDDADAGEEGDGTGGSDGGTRKSARGRGASSSGPGTATGASTRAAADAGPGTDAGRGHGDCGHGGGEGPPVADTSSRARLVRRSELSRRFDELCERLAARGWPARQPHATPREHAVTLAGTPAPAGEPAVDLATLAGLIDQVVLGPQPPSAEALARAESELHGFTRD